MPERKLPFRQKSEYRNSKLETISNIKFFNVQNKSLGIRLFRAFEHSNLEFVSDFEFQNSKIEGFRSDTNEFVKSRINQSYLTQPLNHSTI